MKDAADSCSGGRRSQMTEAEMGGVVWCFGNYHAVNKRYFKGW